MNQQIRKLSQSFKYARRGIVQCMRTERNLRIHMCAAFYVTCLAVVGRLQRTECAILCVCFAVMMGAEIINTAIERLCDRQATGYDGAVRDAKDIAAGAVLVCALICVVVGVLLFVNAPTMEHLYTFFSSHLWAVGVLALTVPFAAAFVFNWKGIL